MTTRKTTPKTEEPTPKDDAVTTEERPPRSNLKPKADDWVAKLRAPFPSEQIGKLPRVTCRECVRGSCREHRRTKCQVCDGYHSTAAIHLDYVGHADVTARLLDVDPLWTWEPWTAEEIGNLPPAMRDAGLWIHLTVNGLTRTGFGDAQGKQGPNAVKECIGDALRNAAMRFGVGLELWAKGDREYTKAPDETPEPKTAEKLQPNASKSEAAGKFWAAFNSLGEEEKAEVQNRWPFSSAPGNFSRPEQFEEAMEFIRRFQRVEPEPKTAEKPQAKAAQTAEGATFPDDEPPF